MTIITLMFKNGDTQDIEHQHDLIGFQIGRRTTLEGILEERSDHIQRLYKTALELIPILEPVTTTKMLNRFDGLWIMGSTHSQKQSAENLFAFVKGHQCFLLFDDGKVKLEKVVDSEGKIIGTTLFLHEKHRGESTMAPGGISWPPTNYAEAEINSGDKTV